MPTSAHPAERYGLDWPGKSAARAEAMAPTSAHLREDAERSIRASTTRNLLIEGDNLDALKLLRESHSGAVRMIYIDPPYNTRKDFVYHDDYSESVRAYRGRGNDDDDGRFHAGWLSMMYPRMLLARDLLTDDGVMFVSIDRNELAPLTLVLAEVFGDANHLANLVWVSNLKGRQLATGGPAGTHEYILCFARNADAVAPFRGSAAELHELMPAVYRRAGYTLKHDGRGPYITKNELYNTNSRFNERTASSMVYRIHYSPASGEVRTSDIDDETEFPGFVTALPHPNHRPGLNWHAWRWSRSRVVADRDELEFDVSGDTLRIRTKVRDIDGMTLKDVVIGPGTLTGQADLEALGMRHVFDAPKPVALLRTLVATTTSGDDLVLDFFAGSGTTAQAVMEQNALDGGRRRFVLVQSPAKVPAGSDAAAAGFGTIADVMRERVRRAGERARAEDPAAETGFRMLCVDGSEG